LAVSPDGNKLFLGQASQASIIDTVTNTVIKSVNANAVFTGVAVNPAGTRVYMTDQAYGRLYVFDASNLALLATVPVGELAWGVAVTPNGQRIYVANAGNNTVSVIDAANNSVIDTISVGMGPRAYGRFMTP
jgi:YVTN family beta-propeller protein